MGEATMFETVSKKLSSSMRKLVLTFISIFAFLLSNAQSRMIKEVFRLLPASEVFDLTGAMKDSMLQGKTYYPSTNSDIEVQAYNYGSSAIDDYMYVSMSFETEQRGSAMVEIRSFKKTNGDYLVLVSKTGGVHQVTYSQQDLSTFIYDKHKKLNLCNKKVLPSADESIFMKWGIPDSVKKIILNNSNMSFDLSNKKLTLSLNSDYISGNKGLRKWIKGDILYFDWIKDHFVISRVDFQI
jgi:hypothetical protein